MFYFCLGLPEIRLLKEKERKKTPQQWKAKHTQQTACEFLAQSRLQWKACNVSDPLTFTVRMVSQKHCEVCLVFRWYTRLLHTSKSGCSLSSSLRANSDTSKWNKLVKRSRTNKSSMAVVRAAETSTWLPEGTPPAWLILVLLGGKQSFHVWCH